MKRSQLLGVLAGLLCLLGETAFAEKENRERQMVEAGNTCESHIYEGEAHGFFHISKGGRKMFENVLVKADAFLVKHGYLTGPNTVAEWTAKAIGNQKSKP